jgi:hypothetical protein
MSAKGVPKVVDLVEAYHRTKVIGIVDDWEAWEVVDRHGHKRGVGERGRNVRGGVAATKGGAVARGCELSRRLAIKRAAR